MSQDKPSQYQLTKLMALLSSGENSPEAIKNLASLALRFWNAAGDQISTSFPKPRTVDFSQPYEYEIVREAGISFPENYKKIELPQALELLMPKKKSADRMKFFRDFLKETAFTLERRKIDTDSVEFNADQHAANMIESLRKGLLDSGALDKTALRFIPWYRAKNAMIRAAAGRKGGKKSAARRKQKKTS